MNSPVLVVLFQPAPLVQPNLLTHVDLQSRDVFIGISCWVNFADDFRRSEILSIAVQWLLRP